METTGTWVSVHLELPKQEGDNHIYCLVNDKHSGIVVRPYNQYHNCWDGEDADDYYTDAVGGNITHWMALPKGPVR